MGSSEPTAPFRDSGRGGVALLIVDMINRFDFERGEDLKANAARIVQPLLDLRAAMDAADAPVIYVNDNFGEWHSEKSKLVDAAREGGGDIVRQLAPRADDYFILKPQLSGFYATNLPVLLPKLGVSRLVLAGVSTDMCVLFTAGDAHMRDYSLWVPGDVVAGFSEAGSAAALQIMRSRLGAEVRPTSELDLAEWTASLEAERPA